MILVNQRKETVNMMATKYVWLKASLILPFKNKQFVNLSNNSVFKVWLEEEKNAEDEIALVHPLKIKSHKCSCLS